MLDSFLDVSYILPVNTVSCTLNSKFVLSVHSLNLVKKHCIGVKIWCFCTTLLIQPFCNISSMYIPLCACYP